MVTKVFRNGIFIVLEINGVDKLINVNFFNYSFNAGNTSFVDLGENTTFEGETALLENESGALIGDQSAVDTYLRTLTESTGGGVDYEIVAGALRNNSGTWELIDDTNHCGMNIGSIQTLTNPAGDFVRVNFNTTFSKVCTFIVGSDESYVADFTFGGSSVTTSYADIVVSKLVSTSNYIFYNGSGWDYLGDDITLAYSSGVLTITHPNIKKLNVNGISRNNATFDINIGGVTETTTQVYFYDKASGAQYTGTPTTDMKIFFNRMEARRITHAESANQAGEFKNLWIDGKFKA